MKLPLTTAIIALCPSLVQCAQIEDFLLPNREPIVGVYYYPWFRGEPYNHVGWHAEFEYDNINRPDHIREVLRALTDWGVNHAAYSYWQKTGSLPLFRTTMEQAKALADSGRHIYLSPYLEPSTVDKRFFESEARAKNTDFISTYLESTASSPCFARLGTKPFTNIYVTYYRPTETDEDLRSFLRRKYGAIAKLRDAWSLEAHGPAFADQALPAAKLPSAWTDVRVKDLPQGTAAYADLQELRAQRLKQGWQGVIDGVRKRTGFLTSYTGDNSNTIVSPVRYMDALTGLSWYSFGYPITNPTRRPKLMSEIAKYTGTTFAYTIAPGYVDRQQRWTGGRVEHDPFLYEYAWVKALQTLPEGIMILTHSEWYEGSIIDVTKEYGRRPYETTELYSQVFKAAFADMFRHKRHKKPVAVVFNEWTTYYLHQRGHAVDGVDGLIKALECLSVDFDVIPESYLSAGELSGRRVVLAPSCGASLRPGRERVLIDWLAANPTAALIVDEARCWRPHRDRRGLTIAPRGLGQTLMQAFNEAWKQGKVPADALGDFEKMLLSAAPARVIWPEGTRPSSSYEVARGPVVWAGNTAIVPIANTIPWGYIVEHRGVGWGIDRGHSAENTRPWRPEPVRIAVKLPPHRTVAEVFVLDSDTARLSRLSRLSRTAYTHDLGTGLVQLTIPVKFHALLAVTLSPVSFHVGEMTLSPGESTAYDALVHNYETRELEASVGLVAGPGLRMKPVRLRLPPGVILGKRLPSQTRATLALEADGDCAVGNRTVGFKVTVDGKPSYFWRRLRVEEPALVGLRTNYIAGQAGETKSIALRLCNVGKHDAHDVTVKLLGAQAKLSGKLEPGRERDLPMTVTLPKVEAPQGPDAEVTFSAVAPQGERERGLRLLSGGDGTVAFVDVGGRSAVQPDPKQTRNNIYIYFDVDDDAMLSREYDLEAEVHYFDTTGRFLVEYDSAFGDSTEDRYRDSPVLHLSGSNTWRVAVVDMPRARFTGRQNLGADLRISGPVPVSKLIIRSRRPRPKAEPVPATISYRCGKGSWQYEIPVRVAGTIRAAAAPKGLEAASSLYAVNPYGSAVPELAVTLNPELLAARLPTRQGIQPRLADATGLSWPLGLPDQAGTRTAVLPLCAVGPAAFLSYGTPGATDLRVRDQSAQRPGFVAVENRHLGALWDAARGGVLMSLMNMATKADYASPHAGACTVEYTLPDGRHEVSSRWPGAVRVKSQGPVSAILVTSAKGPILRVEDVWTVYAACHYMRLERTITFSKELAAVDFCPLVLRLDPRRFGQTLPLGVGFQKGSDPKRGWLETWHSEGWYFVYGGSRDSASDAVALVATRVDSLRRARYGFVPGPELAEALDPRGLPLAGDELQVRLRAQSQFALALDPPAPEWWQPAGQRIYRPGDQLQVEALIAVAPGLSWRYARELALLERSAAIIASGESPTMPSEQTVRPVAPLYMYPVHAPYHSAALPVERPTDAAPEVGQIETTPKANP